MDIQKKQARWLTEKPLFEAEFIFTALLNNVEFNIKTGDFDVTQDCPESDRELTHEVVNHSWVMWLRAKASAVPEGFVLVPKEGIETWYLDEGEGLWMEDPDHWLCDLDAGEVQEVSRKEYMVTNSTPLFAVKPWDESDGDVGIWRLVDSRGEAEKLAANCEAMIEARGEK